MICSLVTRLRKHRRGDEILGMVRTDSKYSQSNVASAGHHHCKQLELTAEFHGSL